MLAPAIGWLGASTAGAQAAATRAAAPVRTPTISVSPTAPVQGTLVRLTLSLAPGDTPSTIAGVLAGEPLHFERVAAGRYRALAAIPIDSQDALHARVLVEHASGRVDTVARRVAITRGKYPVEKLRVAPQFGSTPDSALAARVDRESAQAREISRRAHETPRLWRGAFVSPRPGRVTSGFGRAREFNGELQSRHMGTDFAGATGAPVRAGNRGIVALVADFYYGGTVIYLDHGGGLVTAHMHLSRAEVAEGDTVSRGAIIGRVGSTGRVTGPHLHWVVRYGAVSVNPLSLLRLTKPASAAPARRAPAKRPAQRPTTSRRRR